MRVRKEKSGIHLFNRSNGLHILLDEYENKLQEIDKAPRTVSIALTNRCDLKCHFCYAPKSKFELEFDYIKKLATELDSLGALELTLGGGEPTLHPQFNEICSWIWDNTKLGISVTTHGHHLNDEKIKKLTNKLSSIRFSIDGLEPYYSLIRGRKLDDLLRIIKSVSGKIHFGINSVISPGRINSIIELIELAVNIRAENILIIPQHEKGKFAFTLDEWKELSEIISNNKDKIEILVTNDAANYITNHTLDVSVKDEFIFAHVSADKKLKKSSFADDGIDISSITNLSQHFSTLQFY
jgi:MoaA/NifB/PqqE/SkfB family radical SAM enzyme